MTELETKFIGLLQAAVQHKSSDIHLMTGQQPAIRAASGLVAVNMPALTQEDMVAIFQVMCTEPEMKAKAHSLQDFDGSFEVRGVGRFRFNIYRTTQGPAAVLRVIPEKIPTVEELGLPPVLKKIADAARGLILVTGATGSGKSSTLAAMIDHLNANQKLHILTVEDPVEYMHPQKKSRVSQREIGRDTKNFATALKSALRQDPDVILVGEMRDHETLDIALKASETGHLVFSTVHTSDAMKTVGRLISLFPPAEQSIARIRLADNLHAIISQRLIPAKTGKKIVAQEILINNLGISDCIANEKKTAEIPGFIEKGKDVSGMQTFDQHLAELVHNDLIDVDVALDYASNPSDFQRNLSFGSTAIEGSSGLSTSADDDENAAQPPSQQPEGFETGNLPIPGSPIMGGTTGAPPPVAAPNGVTPPRGFAAIPNTLFPPAPTIPTGETKMIQIPTPPKKPPKPPGAA